MEKAVFNVKELKVTQGMNSSYSHKGDLAIDISACCSYLKAPFTGTIKKIYTKDANEVWLQSNEKVKYADGTEDYMTIMTIHDNDVSNLKVGQVIEQGTKYYQPGTKGNVTGSHIHIAVGKGKFTGSGWYKNEYGVWCINNQYDITKALFLHTDVKITNAMYNWIKTSNYEYVEETKNTSTSLKYTKGNKVILNGYLYKDSTGNGRGAKKTNYNGTITIVKAGAKKPYHIDKLGWVAENNLIKQSGSIIYKVQKGDYLIKIANKYGVKWTEIAKLNNIKFPYIIKTGQKLKIK